MDKFIEFILENIENLNLKQINYSFFIKFFNKLIFQGAIREIVDFLLQKI